MHRITCRSHCGICCHGHTKESYTYEIILDASHKLKRNSSTKCDLKFSLVRCGGECVISERIPFLPAAIVISAATPADPATTLVTIATTCNNRAEYMQ